MGSNEEYLDSLLKSIAGEEANKNEMNPEDSVLNDKITSDEETTSKFSEENLADMLEQLEMNEDGEFIDHESDSVFQTSDLNVDGIDSDLIINDEDTEQLAQNLIAPEQLEQDKFELDDLEIEKLNQDHLKQEDLSLDDIEQEDLSQNHIEQDNFEQDHSDLDHEDLDSLFSMMDDKVPELEPIEIDINEIEGLEEQFGLREEQSHSESAPAFTEESELDDILAFSEDDEELADIGELLKKSDQNKLVEDDMLALLEGFSEHGNSGSENDEFDIFANEGSEEMGIRHTQGNDFENDEYDHTEIQELLGNDVKDKKKKKKEKKKKKNEEPAIEDQAGVEESRGEVNEFAELGMDFPETKVESGKKQGFFKKIMNALLEEEEEIVEVPAQEENPEGDELIILEENKTVLRELEEEDEEEGKKGKKKKGKEKAEKKEKKPKKEKEEKEEAAPEKKISMKKILGVFGVSFAIMLAIITVSSTIPNMIELNSGRNAYYNEDYKEAYEVFLGRDLSKSDEIIFEKLTTVLQIQRKWEAYENFKKLNMEMEALNSLIQGAKRYYNSMEKAEEQGVSEECKVIFDQIMGELSASYQLDEADITKILDTHDSVIYTKILKSVLAGTGPDISLVSDQITSVSENEMIHTPDSEEPLSDVLNAEEDIKMNDNVIDNTQNSGATNSVSQNSEDTQSVPSTQPEQPPTEGGNKDSSLFEGSVEGTSGELTIPEDISK